MDDMTSRDELRRLVLRQLGRGEFASRFEPVGPNGNRTIVVAMAEDRLSELLHEVNSVGGAANVVTPLFDGLVVFSVRPAAAVVVAHPSNELGSDMTVRELIERLQRDGGSGTYRICAASEGAGEVDSPRILPLPQVA